MSDKIIITDPSFLKMKSSDVTLDEAQVLIKVLEEQLTHHPTGVGLSAIQIGIPKRVAIIRTNKRKIDLINPVIKQQDNEFIHYNEGCLSCPGRLINVKRYKQIILENMEIINNELQLRYYSLQQLDDNSCGDDGIATIAVQHEIDHMNGILIIDKEVVMETYRVQPEIGRNEMCPCGSGKKYKKCCMTK